MLSGLTIVASSSRPLFAFAADGTVAWLRDAGPRLVAIDRATGEALREVRLDPAPFGMAWRVERHGAFFVVRDDGEISAYDDVTGRRLWKRTSPRHVAFTGEREGRQVSVIPSADGEGIDVALADLATGAFDTKLRVEGSMRYVGVHGTLAGNLLFFATDERRVFAVDVATWEVAKRHRLDGAHVLPPVESTSGVHVASIERRDDGAVTHVSTLDLVTGSLVSTSTLPGAAHLLTVGSRGLVVEGRRSPYAPVERIAFRPETPAMRLTVAKDVDPHLVRRDAPRLEAPRRTMSHAHGTRVVLPESVQKRPEASPDGRHQAMVPAPRDGSEGAAPTSRDGMLGLLALLDASSEVLLRIADAYELRNGVVQQRIERLGITLRDPRARWSALMGRDPCLVDLAENGDGDAIATYLYPRARTGRVPVVLVSRATGDARWLADDLDVWFASVLEGGLAYAADAVRVIVRNLDLPDDFPRALPKAIPPPWFFEAHSTTWTLDDADAALAAGDVEGAERMLVAAGRAATGDTPRLSAVKTRLAAVYGRLGWDHHRATVVETW